MNSCSIMLWTGVLYRYSQFNINTMLTGYRLTITSVPGKIHWMSLRVLCTCRYITPGTYWLVSLYKIHQPSIHWSYTRSSHVIITSKCSLQLWNLSGRGFNLRFLSSMCNIPFCVYLSAVLWWRKYQYFHHMGAIKWSSPNPNKKQFEMVKILDRL